MSSSLYALVGVIVGALLTGGLQMVRDWLQARADMKAAKRLVADEIERQLLSLKSIIELGISPGEMVNPDSFLPTSQWERLSPTLARLRDKGRLAKNADRGIWNFVARYEGAVSEARHQIFLKGLGDDLDEDFLATTREDGYAEGYVAYFKLTGEFPNVEPPDKLAPIIEEAVNQSTS